MRKKNAATGDSGFEPGSPRTARITPAEIQEKEFRVARFGGGYRMREVDEFLDELTEALTALIAENERLLAGLPPSAAPASPIPAPAAVTGADRAAVAAFLQREKGFLQSLGGLVQGHAEELKAMARASRRDPGAASSGVGPGELLATPAAAAAAPSPSAPAEDLGESAQEATDTTVPTEEEAEPDAPIRLEDPEPARSGRKDEEPEGSLRELFWGEE